MITYFKKARKTQKRMCAHLQLQQIQRYQRYHIEDELTRVHIVTSQLPVIIYLGKYNLILLTKRNWVNISAVIIITLVFAELKSGQHPQSYCLWFADL